MKTVFGVSLVGRCIGVFSLDRVLAGENQGCGTSHKESVNATLVLTPFCPDRQTGSADARFESQPPWFGNPESWHLLVRLGAHPCCIVAQHVSAGQPSSYRFRTKFIAGFAALLLPLLPEPVDDLGRAQQLALSN